MRAWLNGGVSEEEVRARLQARVPEFSLSPDPGGQWDWLLGVIAIAVASGTLVLLTRRSVARRTPERAAYEAMTDLEFDDEMHWQDRLDDELIDSDT